MSNHNLTRADNVFAGAAYHPRYHNGEFAITTGAPITFVRQVVIGAPIAPDDDNIIKDATSTELPNNGTKTYTTANAGSSPVDNAARVTPVTITTSTGASASVWPLDVPRNIIATSTTAAADTVFTITGYDLYGQKVIEQMTIASGDSSVAGKKAFKYVESIAIYSAGNITTDTIDVGFGDVLGLPFKADYAADVLSVFFNDAAASTTVVAADDATPTATTGDVRGTIDTTTSDGSRIVVWMKVDGTTTAKLFGQAQYS